MNTIKVSYCVGRLLFNSSKRQVLSKVISSTFTSTSELAAKWNSTKYSNPINELQPLLQIPLSSLTEDIFKPSEQEINQGHQIFQHTSDRDVEIFKAEIRPELLPELNLPEVCFIGRSNVGKSSLIRNLLHGNVDVDRKIKVSSRPGFTRSLKVVKVRKLFSLVDMPGYGYNMPPEFINMVEGYLQIRQQLTRVFLLIDGNVGFQSTDHTAIDMLEEYGKPYAVVMTKIDKSTHHKTLKNVVSFLELSKKMPCCFPQPFLVSSLHGYGLPYLQTYIAYVTSSLAIKGL